MAEIPDHLVPQDGLTNSFIRFDGLDATHEGGGARVRFGMYNEEGQFLADFVIDVGASADGTIDQLVAEAHGEMADVLRQWLYSVDLMRQAYEKRKRSS